MLASNLYSKQSLITQLIAHLRLPLYRNGYALILGAATTSILGLVYWALAARYYTPEMVGIGSVVISAMMLLAGVAVLSLSGVLVRFTPLAGRASTRLIVSAYGVSAVAAAFVGGIFCWGAGRWLPELRFLAEDYWWAAAFILATIAWCIFSLQDSALTGLRQSIWIPIENTLFAAVKIVLLVAFAQWFPLWGIFAAWTVPVLISLLPVNLLIFRYLLPQHIQASGGHEGGASRQAVLRYIKGNYPGTLFYLASTTFLPLIVTQQAGAQANAYFFMPWMMAGALLQIALQMSASLTVEAATDQSRLAAYCYRVLLQSARLLAPSVLVFVVGASMILSVFGADYAREGATLFRLLSLAALPNLLVMLYIALARVQNLVSNIIWVQGAQCLLLLSLSYLWLPVYGIAGVGWALLVSQTAIALFLLLTQLRTVLGVGRVAYHAQ